MSLETEFPRNGDPHRQENTSSDHRLIARVRWVDVVIMAAVPVVLGLVFTRSVELRRSLVFDYTDPSLLTAFTANFVHLDGSHLLVNVGLYLLVVPVVYALSVTTGDRQRFYTVFVTVLCVFPVVLSYLNLAVLRPAFAVGFSGIVMAFVGYLPVALSRYLAVQFEIGPRRAVAPALFFFSLAIIATLSVQSVVPENTTVLLGTSGLTLAALLTTILYGLPIVEQGNIRRKLGVALDRSGYFELAAVAIVLCLAVPFVAFPVTPSASGGILNLYVHLLGYALGFMVTYVTGEIILSDVSP